MKKLYTVFLVNSFAEDRSPSVNLAWNFWRMTSDWPGSAATVAEDARSVPTLGGMQLERHCTTSNTKRVEKLTTLQGDLTISITAEARTETPPSLRCARFLLHVGHLLRLSGLFDAIQPLDDASVSLDRGDAIGHPVIGTVIVSKVTVAVLGLFTV